MNSMLYEMVPNPFGGWDVKEISAEGILRSFDTHDEAEKYLRSIAKTEPKVGSVVTNIAPTDQIEDDLDDGSESDIG